MNGIVIPRKPGMFYRDTYLWIPLDHPVADPARRKTTLLIPADNDSGFDLYELWQETDTHLVVPRAFPLERLLNKYGTGDEKIVEITGKFDKVDFKSKIVLDYMGTSHQKPAYQAWMKAQSGILNLACGKGKTVIALQAIASGASPALVIVHTSSLLTQWKSQVENFLPGASIGMVKGKPDRWSWNKDVVLAMLQTLVIHQDSMTPEIRGRFGTIIWDEVHHLGATKFSQTAGMFIGNRYGLSATVDRGDGMEPVYRYHLGRVFYSDLSQQLTPEIYFLTTPVKIDLKSKEAMANMTDISGTINIPKTRSYISNMDDRIDWEIKLYRRLRQAGRTTLVLSHSVAHLHKLADRLDRSGLCTGSVTDLDLRTHALLHHDIVFATTQLAREGLDRPEFDTLVLSTPFGSGISGANNFQQAVGRVLRPVEGKRPAVIILDDINVPPLHRMTRGLMYMLRKWPAPMGGPLSYDYFGDYNKLPILSR